MSFRPHPASRIAVAVIALAALFPPGAWAGTDPISAEIQAVFQRSARAVVKIQAQDPGGELYGTGFFIDPNGTIYTNYSVGGESRDIVVSDGVARYPATRIAADARSGLAILKIEAQKTPFLPLGKSSGLTVASMVMAVGYPLDLPLSPNIGCVGGFGFPPETGFLPSPISVPMCRCSEAKAGRRCSIWTARLLASWRAASKAGPGVLSSR